MGQSFGLYEGCDRSKLRSLVVTVMTMVMVVRSCGKRRSREDHDEENGSENLLHGLNVARCRLWKREWGQHESTEVTS
jgi:hypothetical protein